MEPANPLLSCRFSLTEDREERTISSLLSSRALVPQATGAVLRKEVQYGTTLELGRDDRCGIRTGLSVAGFPRGRPGAASGAASARHGST